MRQCPFHGCEAILPDDRFCCFPHWKLLSSIERGRVYTMYQAYLDEKIDIVELRKQQQEVLGDRGTAAQAGDEAFKSGGDVHEPGD